MGYSEPHETSNICPGIVRRGAQETRRGAALQGRFRDAPMPDPSGQQPRGLSPEDSLESRLRLADGSQRHPRLQREGRGGAHSRLPDSQACVRGLRRGKRRGSQGDAPPMSEGVWIRVEPVDFGDGRGCGLRAGTHRKAPQRGDNPGDACAPSWRGVAEGEAVDHLPRSPVREKKEGATD